VCVCVSACINMYPHIYVYNTYIAVSVCLRVHAYTYVLTYICIHGSACLSCVCTCSTCMHIYTPKYVYIRGQKGAFVASLPQSLIDVKQLPLLCHSSIHTYVTIATQHVYRYVPTYIAAPLTLGPGVCVYVCLCVFTQSHLATRKRRRQRNQRYHSLPAPSSITLLLCSSTRRGHAFEASFCCISQCSSGCVCAGGLYEYGCSVLRTCVIVRLSPAGT